MLPIACIPLCLAAHVSDSEDWLSLDAELRALHPLALSVERDGPTIMASIRAFWAHSSDQVATGPPPGPDVSGLRFQDLVVGLEQTHGDFTGFVSFEFTTGVALLEEAWFGWSNAVGGGQAWKAFRLGTFKPRVLRSASIEDDQMVFADRTLLGSRFDLFDTGFELSAHRGEFTGFFGATNGVDGTADELAYAARVEWDVYGKVAEHEGARDAEPFASGVIGVSWVSDGDDTINPLAARALIFDGAGAMAPFSFMGEYAHLEAGAGGPTTGIGGVVLPFDGGTRPFAAGVTWLYDERRELGLRWQKMADAADTKALTLALCCHAEQGTGRWIAQVTDYDRMGAIEGLVFQVGASFSNHVH